VPKSLGTPKAHAAEPCPGRGASRAAHSHSLGLAQAPAGPHAGPGPRAGQWGQEGPSLTTPSMASPPKGLLCWGVLAGPGIARRVGSVRLPSSSLGVWEWRHSKSELLVAVWVLRLRPSHCADRFLRLGWSGCRHVCFFRAVENQLIPFWQWSKSHTEIISIAAFLRGCSYTAPPLILLQATG